MVLPEFDPQTAAARCLAKLAKGTSVETTAMWLIVSGGQYTILTGNPFPLNSCRILAALMTVVTTAESSTGTPIQECT